jgi:hypothetical protein
MNRKVFPLSWRAEENYAKLFNFITNGERGRQSLWEIFLFRQDEKMVNKFTLDLRRPAKVLENLNLKGVFG